MNTKTRTFINVVIVGTVVQAILEFIEGALLYFDFGRTSPRDLTSDYARGAAWCILWLCIRCVALASGFIYAGLAAKDERIGVGDGLAVGMFAGAISGFIGGLVSGGVMLVGVLATSDTATPIGIFAATNFLIFWWAGLGVVLAWFWVRLARRRWGSISRWRYKLSSLFTTPGKAATRTTAAAFC